MGQAMIRGWLAAGAALSGQIHTSSKGPASQRNLRTLGVHVHGAALPDGAAAVAAASDIIWLGVKPQVGIDTVYYSCVVTVDVTVQV